MAVPVKLRLLLPQPRLSLNTEVVSGSATPEVNKSFLLGKLRRDNPKICSKESSHFALCHSKSTLFQRQGAVETFCKTEAYRKTFFWHCIIPANGWVSAPTSQFPGELAHPCASPPTAHEGSPPQRLRSGARYRHFGQSASPNHKFKTKAKCHWITAEIKACGCSCLLRLGLTATQIGNESLLTLLRHKLTTNRQTQA